MDERRIRPHRHTGLNDGGLLQASVIGGMGTDSGSSGGSAITLPLAAADVFVADYAGDFTGTTVEAVLAELYALGGNANDTSLQEIAATGSTETVDVSVARTYWLGLDANCTITLTGATTGEAWWASVFLEQDAVGSRTVTWPASVKWPGNVAPTLSTAATAVDEITLVTKDGGTKWYGFFAGSSTSIAPLTLILPGATSPAQTAEGSVVWDTDDDVLTIGTGAARKTFGYLGSTVPGNTPGSASNGSGNEVARANHDHGITASGGTSASDANIWRPLMDGSGAVITDGTGQAVMAYGPA